MSTLDVGGLSQLLQSLAVSDWATDHVNASVLANPIDILRVSLARLLIRLVDCKADDAYKSVQWPNDINNGDLSITLPRLRPGSKPKEISSELMDKVNYLKRTATVCRPDSKR
jgi:arginyl-tRNA synthetase